MILARREREGRRLPTMMSSFSCASKGRPLLVTPDGGGEEEEEEGGGGG